MNVLGTKVCSFDNRPKNLTLSDIPPLLSKLMTAMNLSASSKQKNESKRALVHDQVV